MGGDTPIDLGISGDTRVFAIIGDPIAQARSPEVFNALFKRCGANAVLVPLQVPATHLRTVIQGLQRIGNVDGVVVTVPHKVTMLSWVDQVGEIGSRVGAINCLRRGPDGRWIGEMFDGEGFVAGLRSRGFDPAGWHVHQVGAGGAGRAVAHALAAAGIASISLFDVDADRRNQLVAELAQGYPGVAVEAAGRDPGTVDLAVNATPCGMDARDPLPFRLDALASTAVVADLIMKPEYTPLLQRAQERGLQVHLGRHMLENQAELVAAFFGVASR